LTKNSVKKLSIIVPMYKVGPYVEKCLRSLEDQDIPRNDYEIICINDGSPDNSHEVVVHLQKEYENILLIDQENQGVSRARNNGMALATGEYLMMVDPDDFLKPNVLKDRLKVMDEFQLEVGLMGYTILNENQVEEYHYDPIHDVSQVLAGVDLLNKFWEEETGTEERDPHRSVSILFRSSLLKEYDLQYLVDVPYLEDGELMTRIMCLAKRTTFINGQMYMRTTRPGSATHSPLYHSERGRDGFLKAAYNLHHFKLEHCRNRNQIDFINDSIVHFTILSLTSLKIRHYLKNYSKLYERLKKGPLKKLELEGCSSFYKKMGSYYNCSIHCFYLYWTFYKSRELINNTFSFLTRNKKQS